ncbi:MAG: cyclase family protein [Ottowia sp.]|uniref:cyclase family protein n=1 Tax=Ottowia sp. TaxID=1898956 RepID=UPI003C760686
MSTARWKNRPDGSNWGDFGEDDQLGRLNLLTPERTRAAVAEVVDGISFCLSLPLDLPGGNVLNPNRYPPQLRPTRRHGAMGLNFRLARVDALHTDVLSDDVAVLHLQYSTQWDGLAHVGSMHDVHGDGVLRAVYYNGYAADEHVVASCDDAGDIDAQGANVRSRALALGIEHMAEKAVQGRGVMVDLQAHFGQGRHIVGMDDLHQVLVADGIAVEEGDILCLHTGFADAVLAMDGTPDASVLAQTGCVLDGRDADLLKWISESGVAAIVADNYAVEAYPARSMGPACCAALPLHEHCLFKLGVHLGELWHLGPLARHLREQGRYRFLLTAPPLRLPGAIASPMTPVATV